MKRPIKLLFPFLLVLILVIRAMPSASNVYLAQSATGGDTGADCNNAHAYTFFNSAGNWGSGSTQIGAGTVVHLCGTITASANAEALIFQGSGSSGNVITIKWETNAVLQAPYFLGETGGGIDMAGQGFILLDGGTNGIIQNTANGTSGSNSCPGGACSNQQPSTLIWTDCHDCEIKNLTIGPTYVRTSTTDVAFNFFGDGALFFPSGGGQSHSNVSIHDNAIPDGRWHITFNFGSSGSNLKIFNNQIFRMDHGIVVAGQANGINYDGIYIYGNHVYGEATWDDSSGANTYHHDGIHMFAGNGSTATTDHVYIYNNDFDGPVGGQASGNGLTAHVYLEPNVSVATVKNGAVFNNVLTYADSDCLNGCGNGQLGIFSGSVSMLVANNTGIGNATNVSNPLGVCAADNQPTLQTSFVNNVITTCATLALWGTGGSPAWAASQPDFNIYANSGSNSWKVGGTFYTTAQFSNYKTAVGNETHSSYNSSAGLTACITASNCTPTPQAGSAAIGAGTNLFSTCNGQSIPGLGALCSDKAGNARPASAAWDVGAFQFSSPASSTGTAMSGGVKFSGGVTIK